MNRTFSRIACAIVVVPGALFIAGCGSSDEAAKIQPAQQQASATEMMQHDVAMERAKNDSLLVIINRLERDNQAATARAVEAETELADMKTRMAAPQAAPMKPRPSGTGSYEEGLKLFHAHKFDEAAGEFESVLSSGSSPDLADNCHYWLGECAYGTKNYKEAIDHFNQVFTYKISEKKDDAQMMIANSYLAMGDKERAKAEYQKLVDKYPASAYVARAKEKLSRL